MAGPLSAKPPTGVDSDLAAEQHFTDGIVPVCARYCRENFGIESGPGQTPQFATHKILVVSSDRLWLSPATDIGWRAVKHCTPIRRRAELDHGQSVKADHISDHRRAARDGSREVRGRGGPCAGTRTARNPEKSLRL